MRTNPKPPACPRCLLFLAQDDVAALRGSAAGALAQVEDAGSGGTAAVIGQLEALDRVKRRMEEACSTLKVLAAGAGCQCYDAGQRAWPQWSRASGSSLALFPTPAALETPNLPCLLIGLRQEAAGLSALFQRVDDHFASNDLPRVAEALAGMRRGLAVVGDSVAEFRGG